MNQRNISIIQWNCSGILSSRQTLNRLISQHNPHILVLQETHLPRTYPTNQPFINGFKFLNHNNADSNTGGIGFLIKNNLQYTISSPKTKNLAMTINLPTFNISISNIYVNNNRLEIRQDLQTLYNSNHLSNWLILGDLNAHSPLWGSPKECQIGKKVEEWLDTTDLLVLNDGSPTLNATNGSLTHIDVSLSTPELSTKLFWETVKPWPRDHFPIVISSLSNNSQQQYSNLNFKSCRTYDLKPTGVNSKYILLNTWRRKPHLNNQIRKLQPLLKLFISLPTTQFPDFGLTPIEENSHSGGTTIAQ